MTQTYFIHIIQNALFLILLLSAPVLGVSLVVGLVVGIFQAATQIQEQTLTFVPKIIAVFFVLILTGSWLLSQLVNFMTNLYGQIPGMVR